MTRIPLASSLSQVKPSQIRAIADVAFGMEGVLRLQFGESNQPTPDFIKTAATQALDDGYTFYIENAGLPSLREAVAAKYDQLHQVKLEPAELMITASGVQALNVAIRCVIDPGDEAIILSPNWPNASEIVNMFGGAAKEIPYGLEDEQFSVDFEALEAAVTPKTRLLVYTSPSNPLGWVATVGEQQKLLDFCRRHRIWLMADEVYERLYYEGNHIAPSILRLCTRDDAVIVVNSFSKSYSMTGWRLGWVASRADLITKAAQLNEFIVSHAPSMIQRAGETALAEGESYVKPMVAELQGKMAFCYESLASVKGVTLPKPRGAFYLFPSVEGLDDSFTFALNLLKEEKVAIAPGVAFGNGGEGSFRLCFATDRSILEPAMERIGRFIERNYA